MRFYNVDYHISVISDVKNILERLGHTVDFESISSHSHLIGMPKSDAGGLGGINPLQFGQNECDNFYKIKRRVLFNYDAFIVTHSPMFITLYERIKKPVICVVSTRFDIMLTDHSRRSWIIETIKRMYATGQLILVANNSYDQWNTEYHTGIKPILIPSLCEYTNCKWEENNNKPFYHGSHDSNCPLPIDRLPNGYKWEDVVSYKYCLSIPYNVSIMSLFEYHTMGLPMLLPSKKWVEENPHSLSQLHTYSLGRSPHDYKKAFELSDWHIGELPGIIFFDNIKDIPNIICNKIPPTYGQLNRKLKIIELWKNILEKLK